MARHSHNEILRVVDNAKELGTLAVSKAPSPSFGTSSSISWYLYYKKD